MALVKAQCTNCNGVLEVDNTKDAAVCPFCGTPYVIEKAINHYVTYNNATIINNGKSLEELQKNGFALLKMGDNKNAYSVFQQLVQQDPNDWKNWFGLSFGDDYSSILTDLQRARGMAPDDYKETLSEMCSLQETLFTKKQPALYYEDRRERAKFSDYLGFLIGTVGCLLLFLMMLVSTISSSHSASIDYEKQVQSIIVTFLLFVGASALGIMTAVRYKKYKETHDRNQAVNDYYQERTASGKRLRELAIQILNSIC